VSEYEFNHIVSKGDIPPWMWSCSCGAAKKYPTEEARNRGYRAHCVTWGVEP
jgi:hypothetical protein